MCPGAQFRRAGHHATAATARPARRAADPETAREKAATVSRHSLLLQAQAGGLGICLLGSHGALNIRTSSSVMRGLTTVRLRFVRSVIGMAASISDAELADELLPDLLAILAQVRRWLHRNLQFPNLPSVQPSP